MRLVPKLKPGNPRRERERAGKGKEREREKEGNVHMFKARSEKWQKQTDQILKAIMTKICLIIMNQKKGLRLTRTPS